MPEFPAILRMDQSDTEPVRVVASVDADRISLRFGSTELGTWPIETIDVTPAGSGFDLAIEGERARLVPDDPAAFAAALPEPASHHDRRTAELSRRFRRLMGRPRALLVVGAVVLLVTMLLLAPVILGTVLLLAGGAGLIGSIVYGSDPIRASRLPGRLRPSGIAVLGGICVVAGLVLAFLG